MQLSVMLRNKDRKLYSKKSVSQNMWIANLYPQILFPSLSKRFLYVELWKHTWWSQDVCKSLLLETLQAIVLPLGSTACYQDVSQEFQHYTRVLGHVYRWHVYYFLCCCYVEDCKRLHDWLCCGVESNLVQKIFY